MIQIKAMYPSLLQMLNCSKETKLYTVLHIDNTRRRGIIKLDTAEDKAKVVYNPADVPGLRNIDVTAFFADAIYTEANAIAVGQYFNLPDFDGIDTYMEKNFPGIVANSQGRPVETNRLQVSAA